MCVIRWSGVCVCVWLCLQLCTKASKKDWKGQDFPQHLFNNPSKLRRGGEPLWWRILSSSIPHSYLAWVAGRIVPGCHPTTHLPSSPCCLVSKLCPTLCNPMDHSPPGSSVHRISQARILEWVAISSFVGSSPPRDLTRISCLAGNSLSLNHLGAPSSPTPTQLQILL